MPKQPGRDSKSVLSRKGRGPNVHSEEALRACVAEISPLALSMSSPSTEGRNIPDILVNRLNVVPARLVRCVADKDEYLLLQDANEDFGLRNGFANRNFLRTDAFSMRRSTRNSRCTVVAFSTSLATNPFFAVHLNIISGQTCEFGVHEHGSRVLQARRFTSCDTIPSIRGRSWYRFPPGRWVRGRYPSPAGPLGSPALREQPGITSIGGEENGLTDGDDTSVVIGSLALDPNQSRRPSGRHCRPPTCLAGPRLMVPRSTAGCPVPSSWSISSERFSYRDWVEAYARNHKIPMEWAIRKRRCPPRGSAAVRLAMRIRCRRSYFTTIARITETRVSSPLLNLGWLNPYLTPVPSVILTSAHVEPEHSKLSFGSMLATELLRYGMV